MSNLVISVVLAIFLVYAKYLLLKQVREMAETRQPSQKKK